jgi:ABC-type enterochelin transport system ATPase subunit
MLIQRLVKHRNGKNVYICICTINFIDKYFDNVLALTKHQKSMKILSYNSLESQLANKKFYQEMSVR